MHIQCSSCMFFNSIPSCLSCVHFVRDVMHWVIVFCKIKEYKENSDIEIHCKIYLKSSLPKRPGIFLTVKKNIGLLARQSDSFQIFTGPDNLSLEVWPGRQNASKSDNICFLMVLFFGIFFFRRLKNHKGAYQWSHLRLYRN